jgi:hypothetical protein
MGFRTESVILVFIEDFVRALDTKSCYFLPSSQHGTHRACLVAEHCDSVYLVYQAQCLLLMQIYNSNTSQPEVSSFYYGRSIEVVQFLEQVFISQL